MTRHPRTPWIAPALRAGSALTVRPDVVAGLSLAAFVVPESIAYATLAGLPAVSGLACYLVAGVAYAIFGTSRRIAIGPTSALAVLLATSLLPLARGDAVRYAEFAGAVAILAGVTCIAAWIVRAGYAVNFMSSVVLTGFKTGAALYIASTQIPKLFRLPDGSGNVFQRLGALAVQLPHAHVPSVILGFALVAGLLVLAHRFRGRPTTLAVVIVVLIAMHVPAVAALGIRTAGAVALGLPHVAFPLGALTPSNLTGLVPIALACAFLAYVETIATGRSLAESHGDAVDAERELLALGAANLAVGAFHGFPVSGGMSQSAVNDLSGARTPLSIVVTSGAIAVVLAFLASLFSAIPDPLLGAIVVVAAVHLVSVRDLERLWNSSRHEFWLAVYAAIAVVASGLLEGVMWAAVVSLLMVVIRSSRPSIAVLGKLPGTTFYGNVRYNADAERPAHILAVRTFGPWYYFNSAYIHEKILAAVDAFEQPPRAVIIDFSASPSLDVQSVATLQAIDEELHARGIGLAAARLYDETANALRRTGGLHEPFASHETVNDLVERYAAVAPESGANEVSAAGGRVGAGRPSRP